MTVILIILLIIVAPFIGATLYGVYLIVTGKDKDPEIQAKLEDYKKRKAEKKAKKKAEDEDVVQTITINIDINDNKAPEVKIKNERK